MSTTKKWNMQGFLQKNLHFFEFWYKQSRECNEHHISFFGGIKNKIKRISIMRIEKEPLIKRDSSGERGRLSCRALGRRLGLRPSNTRP